MHQSVECPAPPYPGISGELLSHLTISLATARGGLDCIGLVPGTYSAAFIGVSLSLEEWVLNTAIAIFFIFEANISIKTWTM